jgi:hypothetical protein
LCMATATFTPPDQQREGQRRRKTRTHQENSHPASKARTSRPRGRCWSSASSSRPSSTHRSVPTTVCDPALGGRWLGGANPRPGAPVVAIRCGRGGPPTAAGHHSAAGSTSLRACWPPVTLSNENALSRLQSGPPPAPAAPQASAGPQWPRSSHQRFALTFEWLVKCSPKLGAYRGRRTAAQ